MDLTELDGKQIAAVWWPDNETEQGRHIEAGDLVRIEMRIRPERDSHESWIVEYRKDLTSNEFKEFARHNPRYVESIIWL